MQGSPSASSHSSYSSESMPAASIARYCSRAAGSSTRWVARRRLTVARCRVVAHALDGVRADLLDPAGGPQQPEALAGVERGAHLLRDRASF